MVSSKKTLTVLQRGVDIVRQAVEADSRDGVAYLRLHRLADLSRRGAAQRGGREARAGAVQIDHRPT